MTAVGMGQKGTNREAGTGLGATEMEQVSEGKWGVKDDTQVSDSEVPSREVGLEGEVMS